MKPVYLSVLTAVLAAGPWRGAAAERAVHAFLAVAMAPDGRHVASIEGTQTPSGAVPVRRLVIRSVDGGAAVTVALPCEEGPACVPSYPAWSADSAHLAFILRTPDAHRRLIVETDAEGTAPQTLLQFDGTLVGLAYAADGRLAVLATPGAAKEVGATAAGAAMVGVLGAEVHEQRIGEVAGGQLRYASPADLFVYEYDFVPGGGYVGTAALGDGDNNWWVATLDRFEAGRADVLFKPDPQLQLADPHVSPDGRSVSFIGGLMSDFGATGGDAYVLSLSGGAPRNLTSGLHATVHALDWQCGGGGLRAMLFAQDRVELAELGLDAAAPHVTYAGTDMLGGIFGGDPVSGGCAGTSAVVRQFFTRAPEIAVGHGNAWHDLTAANDGMSAPVRVRSLAWKSDGLDVQGWLLLPRPAKSGKLPLVVSVHGGPAWGNFPHFLGEGLERKLLEAGYALLLPNPRGSYGQGEAFTRANVKDFGHGDLRDILAGVDAAERAAPIDDARLGITGWSYGGYMTMFAVTQTNRFAAAVAGAGLSNWQSYYGENGIDAWMIPYFGASVYADPAVYAKSSPMTYITRVHTPTLAVVGERDIECPAPQTEEFWHALHDLGVPSEAVIYPGEGHAMQDPAHLEDYENRSVGWFDTYLARKDRAGGA